MTVWTLILWKIFKQQAKKWLEMIGKRSFISRKFRASRLYVFPDLPPALIWPLYIWNLFLCKFSYIKVARLCQLNFPFIKEAFFFFFQTSKQARPLSSLGFLLAATIMTVSLSVFKFNFALLLFWIVWSFQVTQIWF